MNKDLLQKDVLEAIKNKLSNKTKLANRLADLLCIEKEAVYRRLRGEVPFSFSEIAIIANDLGISLDNIISSTLSVKSRPFQLKLVNYYDPTEMDYTMMEQYLTILREGKDDLYSELMDCTNILPPCLYYGYKYIERLHLFKSIYQSGNTNKIQNFKEVAFTERMQQIISENVWLTKHFESSYYILDPFIFDYIVNDIIYYSSINMISPDDRQHLKKELSQLLNDLEELAAQGVYKDTGKRVYLYLGSVNFNLSYWYVSINRFHVSMIKSFVLNNFASMDEESFAIMKSRVSALLRSSTLISVSGERQRRIFFDKQHKRMATL